jgi:hypothetical protein
VPLDGSPKPVPRHLPWRLAAWPREAGSTRIWFAGVGKCQNILVGRLHVRPSNPDLEAGGDHRAGPTHHRPLEKGGLDHSEPAAATALPAPCPVRAVETWSSRWVQSRNPRVEKANKVGIPSRRRACLGMTTPAKPRGLVRVPVIAPAKHRSPWT